MITPRVKRFLQRFVPSVAERWGAKTLALGIVHDHVHLVIMVPSRWDLPRMMQSLKGASSHEVNRNLDLSIIGLRWANGYDASTISPSRLKKTIEYVRDQSLRHPERAIEP